MVFWRNIDVVTGNEVDVFHTGITPVNWTKYGMNVWVRHSYYIPKNKNDEEEM